VSERFRRGPEFRVLSLLKPFSFLPRNYDATCRWPPRRSNEFCPPQYSIVSMPTVCAICPPHATAKGCSPPALTRPPSSAFSFVPCTLVQVERIHRTVSLASRPPRIPSSRASPLGSLSK